MSHKGGGVRKEQKSVTYYLNGPLSILIVIQFIKSALKTNIFDFKAFLFSNKQNNMCQYFLNFELLTNTSKYCLAIINRKILLESKSQKSTNQRQECH